MPLRERRGVESQNGAVTARLVELSSQEVQKYLLKIASLFDYNKNMKMLRELEKLRLIDIGRAVTLQHCCKSSRAGSEDETRAEFYRNSVISFLIR